MVDEPHQWANIWTWLSTICAATALLRLRHFLLPLRRLLLRRRLLLLRLLLYPV